MAAPFDASQIRNLLIDLDDCLYDIPEFPRLMMENIQRFMEQRLAFPGHNVSEVCADLYLGHGTTLAGLTSRGYRIDYDDWHAHAHGVLPYHLVRRDEQLRAVLQAIPQPKWVFTNADRLHAERCLEGLGIADLFEGLICFETTMAAAATAGLVKDGVPVVCKPAPAAMQLALERAGAQPETTLFCDDSLRNIAAGKALGLRTVLVRKSGSSDAADLQVASLHQLPAALPALFPAGVPNAAPSTSPLQQNGVSAGSHAGGAAAEAAAAHSVGSQVASPRGGGAVGLSPQGQPRGARPMSPTCRQQQLEAEVQPPGQPQQLRGGQF